MAFPKQKYWSGLPFSSPGYLPDPGIEPASPAWQEDSLPLSHQGNPLLLVREIQMVFLELSTKDCEIDQNLKCIALRLWK